jgi:very-short-patch-repair endonuclease
MRVQPSDVRRRCTDLGDVVRRDELRQLGVDEHSVKAAVRSGEIIRIREGVYASADVSHDVISAVAHGGRLGCVSRIRAAGIWVLDGDDDRVHVSMPRTGNPRRHEGCRCVAHWTGGPAVGGLSPLVEALAQMLSCRGIEQFFVALESAMRRRLLDHRSLGELHSRLPRKSRWVVEFARWDADSGLESLLRLRLRALGLSLASQVQIPGVGRVDFLLAGAIVLEVDGVAGHADGASSRHKDLVRDAVSSTYGLEALRFDYAMVVHDWPLVEAAILAALDRSRHRRR